MDTGRFLAASFTRQSGEPAPDPLGCLPGSEFTSTFSLANAGNDVRALLTGGAKRVVGARIREVTVTDWNGADRLELRRPSGSVAVLTPEHPSVLVGPHDLPLSAARWKSGRSTPGVWSDPTIQVRHACPSGPAPMMPPGTTSVTWSELDGFLRAATGGLGLELWRPRVADADLPGVRAHLELGDATRSLPDHLVFEAAGGGRLDALLLARTGADSWSFRHRRKGLEIEGTVTRSGTDLLVQLEGGRVESGGLTLDLAPAPLLLLGGSAQ